MISIHKVIFPGIAAGCLFLVLVVSLIANPTPAMASGSAPQAATVEAPAPAIVDPASVNPDASVAVGAAVSAGTAADLIVNIEQQARNEQPTNELPGPEQANAASGNSCSLSQAYPDSIRQWCAPIERHASEHGLDPNLLAAVMLQESGGNPQAYSKSGAVGLLQVMPRDGLAASFMCKNGPCFATRPSTQELYDPEFNISYGAQMLAELIQKYGDVREALLKYGPMDMGYRYADIILSIFNRYR